METLNLYIATCVLALLLTVGAWAAPSGVLLAPSEGRPVIQVPGASITVSLRQEASLSLVQGDSTYPLVPTWSTLDGDRAQATCALPANLPAGIYALRANLGKQADVHEGAVVVVEALPEALRLYVGAAPKGLPDADTRALWIQWSDEEAVAIALPAQGTIQAYEHRYGALPFTLEVGDYGLLFFDGQDSREARLGQLYPLRRALIAKTWTVAISTTPCANLPFRAQLTLFEDDPVQLLLSPTPLPEAFHEWSHTRFRPYPSVDAPLRVMPNRLLLPDEKP